ncbi:MAG TPA: nitronate monooxygenase family protein [Acidimicrobiales bacterium]|nr:nitronate monooxygenase family protein [Acidimicrobiales bacterium]
MHTRVSDLLGVEYPILAFSHCRDVVAAVTNAGGFGVLGATAHTPEQLDIDLGWIDDQVKGRPYGVDLLFPTLSSDIAERGANLADAVPDAHRAFVADLLERYGVPPLPEGDDGAPEGRQRAGLGLVDYEPLYDIAFDRHHVRLIASALGSPPAGLVERAHASGAVVAALAGLPVHAERHTARGVDLIVAQGTEAGGHTGEISTMVLVPQVVDAVAPTPVLAAGGIANGRQVAAAMALGAEGVWCGSVWLTTAEAETHPAVKDKFLAASSRDTVRSRTLTSKPARMLKSAWTEEWDQPAAPPPLGMPLQGALIADAQARIRRSANRRETGAWQLANYFVGQVVGQLDGVRPARQVVLEMVTEYADAAGRFVEQLREA